MSEEERAFARRVAIASGIVLLVGLGAALVVLATPLWLLVFAALLLAILLRAASDALSARTPLPPGGAYAVVVLASVLLLAGGSWGLVAHAAEDLRDVGERLPALLAEMTRLLRAHPLGSRLLAGVEALQEERQLVARVRALLSLSVEGLGWLLVLFFAALFLGASPRSYREGLVRLFPHAARARTREVLAAVAHTLRWYLVGRLLSMLAVGVLTGVGLALLEVPLAALLGLVAGLLTFVPYAGPVAAALPIGLVALLEGPERFLWTLLFYTVVQNVEGFVITPLVQKRMVSLPPAVTLLAQVLLGLLVGPLGIVLAVPLAAALLVVLRRVYREGVLGDREEPPDAAVQDGGG